MRIMNRRVHHNTFFFPSHASVALARSSHIVVLMNELFRCIFNVPSWGVESGVRTITQSEVLSVLKDKKHKTKKNSKNKHKKQQQKPTGTEGELTRRSKGAGSLCANELRDLAQKQIPNNRRVHHNTSSSDLAC